MRNNSVPDERVRELMELLIGLGRRNSLRDPLSQLVEQTKLGPAQVHALMWLFRDGPLSMHVLASRLGINQKTVTGVVDRLEKGAYVERARDSADRRVVTVVITRKGRTLATQLDKGLEANMRVLLQLLDSRDQEDLFRILKNLQHNLQQRAPVEGANESP